MYGVLTTTQELTKASGSPSQIDYHGWNAAGGGINKLSPGFGFASGWGLETILTMSLVFTVFAATDAERAIDTAHIPVRVLSVYIQTMSQQLHGL
jgi:glycerol uptake facilitator-like aquaporin